MTCYGPQGENLSGWPINPWYPCNYTTADGFVPCCQPSIGECQANKACSYTLYGIRDVLIRGGCTDSTFNSASCPQFHLEGATKIGANGNIIHDCMNGTGCYNLSNHGSNYNDYNCSCQQGAPNLLLIEYDTIVYASAVSSSSAQRDGGMSLTHTMQQIDTPTGSSITASQTLLSSLITTPFSDTITVTESTSEGSKSTSMPTSMPASGSTDLAIRIDVPVGVIGGLVLVAILGFLLWKLGRKRLSKARKRRLQSKELGVALDEPGVAIS